ncbi:M4 family metallopeptidase [Comamonas endophytica]|uniref:Neutral metalloproteinase n=1 Tax=Comamonas endophytica TaxID=2949090 RepID=A0ABY6GB17_9BURK|nr:MULTISPECIES: M4 family metallopeptidase [unclassified Acidovorax]MCD2511855.1 M4 family metallopeptidase [Acidovorax sp. D4N7]UYG51577.1 M4 family metallopeptidase [Acidovorax sp. 5MLIR]
MYRCHCQFIPADVLERLACDPTLSQELCKNAAYSARLTQHLLDIRLQTEKLAGFVLENHNLLKLGDNPEVSVFDCKRTQSLPGLQIRTPAESSDTTVKRTYVETDHMATFLREVFKRNSIDDAGMTLMSSVHYGKKYNNAMWNGLQMIYGDGDGELFLDFTLGTDVIGHELAHGITQYTLQLDYDDEAGGLNESMSDVFGSMFRQWRLKQDAASADWLVGKEVMGPVTRERGYTCLRDMSAPAGEHCLAPQPDHFRDLKPGQDPHYTSGPPNLAFCTACKQLGGYSWETIGKVWYQVMTTAGLVPRMKMADFAARSRQAAGELFGNDSPAQKAVDKGWKKVGL